MLTVILESSGDHSFDIPHMKRSGSETLVKKLLEKAGFLRDMWRVRINEKQSCSSLTRPLSIIRSNKWGIYLRIKSGDNNTCHNVTLLLPRGQNSDLVFGKLKSAEESINKSWKKP